jgi:hypothetical protein
VKIPFYALFGTAAALGGYFFVSSVLGGLSLGGRERAGGQRGAAGCRRGWLGCAVLGLPPGRGAGRWLAGFGAVLLAVLAFQAVMVAGRLALG